jgi:hypothetical protein
VLELVLELVLERQRQETAAGRLVSASLVVATVTAVATDNQNHCLP